MVTDRLPRGPIYIYMYHNTFRLYVHDITWGFFSCCVNPKNNLPIISVHHILPCSRFCAVIEFNFPPSRYNTKRGYTNLLRTNSYIMYALYFIQYVPLTLPLTNTSSWPVHASSAAAVPEHKNSTTVFWRL